jgi:hypothetical protein
VTDVPDFEPPTSRPPELNAPNPRPTEFVRIFSENQQTVPTDFRARVVSVDGLPLVSVLLIDYGKTGIDGSPWVGTTIGDEIDAAKIADGQHDLAITWFASPTIFDFGCHTVTMLVTHAFAQQNPYVVCPKDPCDFAAVTWHTTLCDPNSTCIYDDCPLEGEEGVTFTYCPPCETSTPAPQ